MIPDILLANLHGVDIHAGYNAEHAARRIERTQPALIAGGL